MTLFLESSKIRRTGYLPAFLAGGLLAGMVPVMNMAVRSQLYTSQSGNPFSILMNANWQLMAQLNVLLLVCGACILYHTEYADNGMQKAETLPVNGFRLFWGKLEVLFLSCLLPICLETVSLLFSCIHWFPDNAEVVSCLSKGMLFAWALLLPTGAAMLFLSSLCRNMWISLGIGIILVFTASMLPRDSFITAVAPFCAPYRMLHELSF